MLEQLLLTPGQVDGFVDMMNDNNEYSGQFLAHITDAGLVFIDGYCARGGQLDAAEMNAEERSQLLNELNAQYQIAKSHPGKYALVYMHTHGREFGQIIKQSDPYWTLEYTGERERGSLVDDRFFVSRRSGGDDTAFADMAKQFEKLEVPYYHLFVHPAYGSEGSLMGAEQVQLNMFKYNKNNIGNVEEIPIKFH